MQKAFSALDHVNQAGQALQYVEKPLFELHPQGGYVGGGELMAAMILKGYPANFSQDGEIPRALRAKFLVEKVCSRIHLSRLFIAEAHFKGVSALLDKHQNRHPNLGTSIFATELEVFGRTGDSCPNCKNKLDQIGEQAEIYLAIANLFAQRDSDRREIFCGDIFKRLQNLKNKGVKIILGYDGTKIHEHPFTKKKV